MSEPEEKGNFSAEVLARLLDITPQRFHQLVKLKVIPQAARGQYPLAAAVRGYINFLRRTGGTSETDPELLPPRERRAHYEADIQKLALQQKRGDLVPRIEVEQEQGRVAKIVAHFFDTLPDVLERDCGLAPKQILRVQTSSDAIREQIFEALVKEEPHAGSAAS